MTQRTLRTALKITLVILLFIVLFLLARNSYGVEFRRAETFEDAFGATCRVSVSGARGTGFFIGTEGNDAYIITNYHVVTKNQTATLDFWTNGRRQSISGKIDWRSYNVTEPYDFAAVVVDATELKEIDPPFVSLGGADAKPSVGAVIISSGAPDGRFPQAWKGQVLEYYNGKTAVFSPPPVPGQSGSPICEYVDGELFVTGILTWLLGEKGRDDSKGGAIPIMNLYKALGKRGVNVDFHDENAAPAIPPNASECAESVVHALEFYSDDCPACLKIAPEIVKLENQGIVERVNTDAAQGAVFAEQCGITELPTVVILVGDAIAKKVSYDEMKRLGVGTAVKNAIAAVQAQYSRQRQEPKEIEGTLNLPELPNDTSGASGGTDDSSEAEQNPEKIPTFRAPDFRERPSVYESPDNVGIFEDSDARWRNRGGSSGTTPLRPRPKPEKPKVEPQTPPAQGGEQPEQPNQGGGIFGGNRRGIIGGAQDNLFKRYSGELEKFVDAQIGKVLVLLKQSKSLIFYFLTLAVVVGALIADAIKAAFSWILRKFGTWRQGFFALLAQTAQMQLEAFNQQNQTTEPPPKSDSKKTTSKK